MSVNKAKILSSCKIESRWEYNTACFFSRLIIRSCQFRKDKGSFYLVFDFMEHDLMVRVIILDRQNSYYHFVGSSRFRTGKVHWGPQRLHNAANNGGCPSFHNLTINWREIELKKWIFYAAGSGLLPRAELSAPWHQVLQHPNEQQRSSQVGWLWFGKVMKNYWWVSYVETYFRLYNAEDKERPYTNKVITLWYRWVNFYHLLDRYTYYNAWKAVVRTGNII